VVTLTHLKGVIVDATEVCTSYLSSSGLPDRNSIFSLVMESLAEEASAAVSAVLLIDRGSSAVSVFFPSVTSTSEHRNACRAFATSRDETVELQQTNEYSNKLPKYNNYMYTI